MDHVPRTVSSSAATSRAIAGTGVPDADVMMISARRTLTGPCFPRRTICLRPRARPATPGDKLAGGHYGVTSAGRSR
jgi:hypothetical protein